MKTFVATFIPINRPGSSDLDFEMPFEASDMNTAWRQANDMTDRHPWKLIKMLDPETKETKHPKSHI
jgi:hypothetical protein